MVTAATVRRWLPNPPPGVRPVQKWPILAEMEEAPTKFQRWIVRHGTAYRVSVVGFAALCLASAVWSSLDGADLVVWLVAFTACINVFTVHNMVREAERAVLGVSGRHGEAASAPTPETRDAP